MREIQSKQFQHSNITVYHNSLWLGLSAFCGTGRSWFAATPVLECVYRQITSMTSLALVIAHKLASVLSDYLHLASDNYHTHYTGAISSWISISPFTMSSFWHNRNNPEQGAQEEQESHDDRHSQHHEEPDERTTLLPRQGSGYLSPDDPAVCPLPCPYSRSSTKRLPRSPPTTSGASAPSAASPPCFSP